MKFKALLYLLTLLILCSGGVSLEAQKYSKVYATPDIFKRPEDTPKFENGNIANRSENAAWVVVSDRINNQTYREPDAQKFKRVGFKEFFYVVDDKKEWLHIIKTSPGNLSGTKVRDSRKVTDYGWIKRKNLLLWTTGLIDKRTKIHKKAFLLNKASEISKIMRLEKKEVVPIYQGPNTVEKEGDKTIYEFYFILKKENNKYLLSKEYEVGSHTITEDIVGWVESDRLTSWNTRVAMEPNFEDAGFNERRSNNNLQLVAYQELVACSDHATKGQRQADNLIHWKNDPVGLSPSLLSREDPKRFPGGVVRFPLLESYENTYKTGVVGDVTVSTMNSNLGSAQIQQIKETNYAKIAEVPRAYREAAENYNILFVVEATPSMNNYKEAIAQSIDELNRTLVDVENIRYGVALYRDIPESKASREFEIKSLTKSYQDVINFLNQTKFDNVYDQDPYTSMNMGIYRAMQESGMNSNHTNIVFLVGNNGDFSSLPTRKQEAMSSGNSSLKKGSEIVPLLAKQIVHIAGVQCKDNNDRASAKFASSAQKYIVQSAVKQYEYYKDVKSEVPGASALQFSNPFMPDLSTGNNLSLNGGSIKGRLVKPRNGENLSSSQFKKAVNDFAREVFMFREDFISRFSRMIDEGAPLSSVSSGEFAPAFAKALKDYFAESRGRGWTPEDIKKIVDSKYKLYTEVYIPKQITGASNETVSYVLFMPKKDLEDYNHMLKQLALSINQPPDKQREELFNTLMELVNQFTGEKISKSGDITIDELRELMQGVEGLGIKLTKEGKPFKIKDVKNKRAMPDEEIYDFISQMVERTKRLRQIAEQGSTYEFSYTSDAGKTYYWIPVEYTF